jgi:hypothetical protein
VAKEIVRSQDIGTNGVIGPKYLEEGGSQRNMVIVKSKHLINQPSIEHNSPASVTSNLARFVGILPAKDIASGSSSVIA